ncbi:unnamed protein product [Phaedon cochleariae]|uniref:A-kinase anchor protein 2 C-terminal domain-containing protein n=1 Tax=Phaedon cochleariae TaxID=80249 RepID=A0A9N9SH18_PHACE|nr:unnamed protein product [Phaedon cochleariae]
MNNSKKSTLDLIQNEIIENIRREKELKNGFSSMSNPDCIKNNNNSVEIKTNGVSNTNGSIRRFTPNPNTKGVMHKFFKNRGKVSSSLLKSTDSQNNWYSDASFEPAKLTVEKGKPLRNGYIPAEEKIVKELLDFQVRETELRNERRKSQPDLIAALELEGYQSETNVLKPSKSMASLYQPEEGLRDISSAPSSLKTARSLAELCDISDEEVDMPGKHNSILCNTTHFN